MHRRQPILRFAVAAALLAAGLTAAGRPARADVVTDWNDVTIEAIVQAQLVSTRAARALAAVHVAMFDAVNAADRQHQVFHVNAPPVPAASPEAAAAAAAHCVLTSMFPDQCERFAAALADSLAAIPDGAAEVSGLALGIHVGAAVALWRNDDHAMEPDSYTPGSDPGQWRPTPPAYQAAMLPQWRFMTPFALDPLEMRAPPPPALASEQYATDVLEVQALGAKTGSTRTEMQTMTAMFWADMPGTITTVGRWNRIAQAAAAGFGNNLQENARLFALFNIALADAGIVAWDSKYHYSFWRPITAIREADLDGNPATTADPTWEPLLMTPAFPEYPSAHSIFSGAAAQLLGRYFGTDDFEFTVPPFMEPGMPRTYSSFWDAAREAGMSRLFGGIHFASGNMEGLEAGRRIADAVHDRFLQPLHDAAELRLSELDFVARDRFVVTARLTNADAEAQSLDLYLILDVHGVYSFWPAWSAAAQSSPVVLEPGQVLDQTIFDLYWPEGAGEAEDLTFWVALVRSGTLELFGSHDMRRFSIH